MSKRAIITKKELQEIQFYFNQVGGFGGTLESGCSYYSESGGFKRIGIIVTEEHNFTFSKNTTIEELKEEAKECGIKWRI